MDVRWMRVCPRSTRPRLLTRSRLWKYNGNRAGSDEIGSDRIGSDPMSNPTRKAFLDTDRQTDRQTIDRSYIHTYALSIVDHILPTLTPPSCSSRASSSLRALKADLAVRRSSLFSPCSGRTEGRQDAACRFDSEREYKHIQHISMGRCVVLHRSAAHSDPPPAPQDALCLLCVRGSEIEQS